MDPNNIVWVHGVAYAVPHYLAIGDSFFVPCLDIPVTYKEIRLHYIRGRPKRYSLTYEERIERGLLGIRIWRVA